MSEKQHTSDQNAGLPHDPGCLNRHVGAQPRRGVGNNCSHRWHSWKKMCSDSGVYNWTKYESLSNKKSPIRTAAYTKGGKTVPDWYKLELKQPKAHEWDVGADSANFFGPCYKPYWHEAHHVVPNSNLRNAISDFASGPTKEELITTVRKGLLEEKYNLNDMDNMITLPLDKEIADAIGLPRHRRTAKHRNHAVYGQKVYQKLTTILNDLKGELVEHKKPAYKSLRQQIVDLSKSLYEQIKSCKSPSLDDMPASKF